MRKRARISRRATDALITARRRTSGTRAAASCSTSSIVPRARDNCSGPNAETFLHDAAAQSLNREAVRDGVLDPAKYQAWAAKHQDALRALPNALKAKFANAASASEALEQAATVRKAALDHYQKSAAGKFLNLKNPQDITRTVGGMGIGLSVSRSIIEYHHGHLWAVPNDGPGATFAFSIPQMSEDVAGARGPDDISSAAGMRGAHIAVST